MYKNSSPLRHSQPLDPDLAATDMVRLRGDREEREQVARLAALPRAERRRRYQSDLDRLPDDPTGDWHDAADLRDTYRRADELACAVAPATATTVLPPPVRPATRCRAPRRAARSRARPASADGDPAPGPTPAPGPSLLVPVLATKRLRAWPLHANGGALGYLPLHDALTRAWRTDAHMAAWSAPHVRHRLAGDAPSRLPGGVPMVLLIIDTDDPVAHATGTPMRPEWWAGERLKLARLVADTGAVVYTTRGGYRIVLRLAAPAFIHSADDIARWKRTYLGALAFLSRAYGIIGDPACADWTRLYRLPRVVRNGAPTAPEVIGDPEHVGTWAADPDGLADDLAEARRLAETSKEWRWAFKHLDPDAARAPGPASRRAARRDLAAGNLDRAAEALAAVIGPIDDGRKPLYLALPAVLLDRGVPPEAVPGLVGEVSRLAGDDAERQQRRIADAHDTVRRWQAGEPVTRIGELARGWPEVAEVLDDVLPPDDPPGVRRLREALTGASSNSLGPAPLPAPLSVEEARARVRELVLGASGAVVIDGGTGLGKTTTAALALEELGGGVLAVPTHAVAEEVYTRLQERGRVAVQWRRGATAEVNVDADGTPNCQKLDEARGVEAAGGSVVEDLCPRCKFQPGCAALRPVGRPGGVVIVPHQLAAKAAADHPNLALVIDEQPNLVEVVEVPRADYDAAAARAGSPADLAAPLDRARARKASRAWRAGQECPAAVEERGDTVRVAVPTAISEAVARHCCVVILTATPVIDELRAVRPDLRVERLRTGATTPQREVIYWSRANKRQSAPGGVVDLPAIGRALGAALDRARAADARRVLVVAPLVVRKQVERKCARVIDAWRADGRELVVEHYHAVAGRNAWGGYDASITVMDPWSHLGDHALRARRLGLDPEAADRALRERVAAELTQAHGRVGRTVQARVQVHVGTVAPAGWSADDTTLGRYNMGRPKAMTTMSLDELREHVAALGGQRAAAHATGIPRATLGDYLRGRPVPERVSRLVAEARATRTGGKALGGRPPGQPVAGGGRTSPLGESYLEGTFAATPLPAPAPRLSSLGSSGLAAGSSRAVLRPPSDDPTLSICRRLRRAPIPVAEVLCLLGRPVADALVDELVEDGFAEVAFAGAGLEGRLVVRRSAAPAAS